MSVYNPITPDIIDKLAGIVGKGNLQIGSAISPEYSYDAGTITEPKYPDLAIFPATTQEVAAILKLANSALIPVTPRGGGTGLAGGSVAIHGGIVIDLQRMNRILHINPSAHYIIVEPAAQTIDIQKAANQHGLLYAGDPCSSDHCVIAGNIATNAGGNRAVKYGVTADQIYELELVTPQGDIVTIGGRLKKNSTGYNLIHLIAGSEGTLAIITKATLKLQPLPPLIANYLLVFSDLNSAIKAVNPILNQPIDLVSLELMDHETMLAIQRYQQQQLFPGQSGDSLLIQLAAINAAELESAVQSLTAILATSKCITLAAVDGDQLWQGRRIWSKAIQVDHPVVFAEDIVVPIDTIEELVNELHHLTTKFGFQFRIAGHAGDGNMHLRVLPGSVSLENWSDSVHKFRQELYSIAYQLGGRLSGEHGIGSKRKGYLKQYINPTELMLLKNIKQAFDPNYILNPGKIFDIHG